MNNGIAMTQLSDKVITELVKKNQSFQKKYQKEADKHVKGQSPQIAVLTCADSRVIPEHIFQASIGELFVIRIAGNVAIDKTVIESLEYAIDHLNITHLIILAHTLCGAVQAAEQAKETDSMLLTEIQKSFPSQDDHIKANLFRQLRLLPQRSEHIKNALEKESISLLGALYDIKDGSIQFID